MEPCRGQDISTAPAYSNPRIMKISGLHTDYSALTNVVYPAIAAKCILSQDLGSHSLTTHTTNYRILRPICGFYCDILVCTVEGDRDIEPGLT